MVAVIFANRLLTRTSQEATQPYITYPAKEFLLKQVANRKSQTIDGHAIVTSHVLWLNPLFSRILHECSYKLQQAQSQLMHASLTANWIYHIVCVYIYIYTFSAFTRVLQRRCNKAFCRPPIVTGKDHVATSEAHVAFSTAS